MLKIFAASKHLSLIKTLSRAQQSLLQVPYCHFSLTAKKNHLILHTEGEIEKIHMKKKKVQINSWQTFKQQKGTQFKVSLIGLPNSGKSSLFNCIIGQRMAIVDKHPGMTRDRKEYQILDGLVKVVDTPGVQVSAFGSYVQGSIKHDIFKQTVTSIHQSDLILVVIDSTKPITNDEVEMVHYLRKYGRTQKIAIACTKCEKIFDESLTIQETNKLGVEEIFFCSGQLGIGVYEIIDYIRSQVPKQLKQNLQEKKRERVKKFEMLIKRMKSEMKQIEEKGINISQWQEDFRKINPQPELNVDLDNQQFQDFFITPESTFSSKRGAEIKNLKMKSTIRICIIGRPNVGKSSLINQILGVERLVVSQVEHTTRDSISSKIIYKNRKIQLIDTAGLNNHIIEKTEQEYLRKAQASTMVSVKNSNVVVYIMDAFSAFKIEDFKLIRKVIDEGRPIIIAVNKWEAIKDQYKYKAKNYLFKQLAQNLGHTIHGHPIVFMSVKLNSGISEMLDSVITAYDKWNTRISTGLLNNWLDKFKKLDNLPKIEDYTLKINFVIQAKVRPPHFIFFVNNKKLFKDNYMRFLTENLAKQFKMDGIPFRITLKSTNNKQNQHKQKREKKEKLKSPSRIKMEELKKKYDNFGL